MIRLWINLQETYAPNTTERTGWAGSFRDHQDLVLLFAGVSPQKTLVFIVFVVGAAHRNIIIVALKKRRDFKH